MKGKILFLALLLFVASCAGRGTHPVKRTIENRLEVFDIRGEAVWKSDLPMVYPIPTSAYYGACGERKGYEPLRIRTVRLWYRRILDVAVWLEPQWGEMTPDEIAVFRRNADAVGTESHKIYEKKCDFKPRLSIVPVGARVEVVNEDRKDHWIVIEGKQKKREQFVQRYGTGPEFFTLETPDVHHVPVDVPMEFVADKADIWHIMSGFHRWMDAWVVVTDKAYFSSADDNGDFLIKGVPRGVYKVNTWHPLLGYSSVIVRVPEESERGISVTYDVQPKFDGEIRSTAITTENEISEQHGKFDDDGL